MDDGLEGESLPLSEYFCAASLFVGRGVSNVFSERPVDSAVFQEQTHD